MLSCLLCGVFVFQGQALESGLCRPTFNLSNISRTDQDL